VSETFFRTASWAEGGLELELADDAVVIAYGKSAGNGARLPGARLPGARLPGALPQATVKVGLRPTREGVMRDDILIAGRKFWRDLTARRFETPFFARHKSIARASARIHNGHSYYSGRMNVHRAAVRVFVCCWLLSRSTRSSS
jgi:hypothetical protein